MCDCLEEEGLSFLFPSILKRLQSEVPQHVGDTSREAAFVILVDKANCTSLDVFWLVNIILMVVVPDYKAEQAREMQAVFLRLGGSEAYGGAGLPCDFVGLSRPPHVAG